MVKVRTVIREMDDACLLSKPEHHPAVVVSAARDDGILEIVIVDSDKSCALEMLEYAAGELREAICCSQKSKS